MSYSASALARRLVGASCAALALSYTPAFAQADQPRAAPPDDAQAPASAPEKPSPWLFAPVFTSNPKLGTTLGATAGYLHFFDPKSRPSMFAATGQYSNTDSMVAGVFARTSFDADHQRLNVATSFGNIKNDYDDYLGTGVPLRNEAELKSFIARYLYRVYGDWFVGAQGIYQNFSIAGETATDDAIPRHPGGGSIQVGRPWSCRLLRLARQRLQAYTGLGCEPEQFGLPRVPPGEPRISTSTALISATIFRREKATCLPFGS